MKRFFVTLLILTVSICAYAGNLEKYINQAYIKSYPAILTNYYKKDYDVKWTYWKTYYYSHYTGMSCEIHYKEIDYDKVRQVSAALDYLYNDDIISGYDGYNLESYRVSMSLVWNIAILNPGDPLHGGFFTPETPLTIYICNAIWNMHGKGLTTKKLAGYIFHESIHVFQNMAEKSIAEYEANRYQDIFKK